MEHRKDICMQLKDHALKAVSPSHLYHKYSRSDFLREKMFMNVVKNIFIRFPSLQFDHHRSWCQITIRCTRPMEKVWEIHHYLWITPTKPLFAVWKIAHMFLVKFFRATMQTPLQVIKKRLMGGKSLIIWKQPPTKWWKYLNNHPTPFCSKGICKRSVKLHIFENRNLN